MLSGEFERSFDAIRRKNCQLQKHKFITFIESFSYLGSCCSFNYNPSGSDEDEFFNTNSFGINGGLNVIGTGESSLKSVVR